MKNVMLILSMIITINAQAKELRQNLATKYFNGHTVRVVNSQNMPKGLLKIYEDSRYQVVCSSVKTSSKDDLKCQACAGFEISSSIKSAQYEGLKNDDIIKFQSASYTFGKTDFFGVVQRTGDRIMFQCQYKEDDTLDHVAPQSFLEVYRNTLE